MPKRRKLAPQLKEDRAAFRKETKKILVLAAEEAVQFFQENITGRQGFLDRSVKKWPKRKKNVDPGRNVLVGKGGGAKLYKSISRTGLSAKRVVIGIKGPPKVYASVHNFGLRAGRGNGFIMPKRQFMGESRVLNKKISRLIKRRIKKIL
jgi:phage gpG-like protein